MPNLPVYKDWPEDWVSLRPMQIIEAYGRGYKGAFREPAQDEELLGSLEWKSFADAAHEFGLAGSGEGKTTLLFAYAMQQAPGVFPGPSQTTGDCVSRGTATACTCTMFAEIATGTPDVKTGRVEGFPGVPDSNQGVVATEPIYGCRGHRGQGASCARLAKAVSEWGGVILRGEHDIPGYGKLDLTKYKSSVGARWGPRTPQKILDYGKKHPIRTVTYIRSTDEARDALHNGYGINCCSGYGFSSRRDKNGISSPRGSWSHAMGWTAVDDSDAARKLGGPLFLVQNSWGRFNSGPKRHDQPDGSFWITERVARGMIRSGGSFAFSAFTGFPPQTLPNLGASEVLR